MKRNWIHAQVTLRQSEKRWVGAGLIGEVTQLHTNPRYVVVTWSNGRRSMDDIVNLKLEGYNP
jgi:hypothetical protein